MKRSTWLQTALFFAVVLAGVPCAQAMDEVRAAPHPARPADAVEFVLGAPPRGNEAAERALYEPIARHLSQATGQRFVYQFSSNWLSYQREMQRGTYDLTFDGPHFVGWRVDRKDHVPVAKLPDDLVFVVVARADNARASELKDLIGRVVCAHASPNLGTLVLLDQFPNPMRQPYLREIKGWDAAYQGVMRGECLATILPLKNFEKFEAAGTKAGRILYSHRPLPNQAMTAGPRIAPGLYDRIVAALLSDAGQKAAAPLLAAYNAKALVRTNREEYRGLGGLLKNEPGFSDTARTQVAEPGR